MKLHEKVRAAAPKGAAEWLVETSVFFVLVVAIVVANVVRTSRRGSTPSLATVFENWVDLAKAVVTALAIYGGIRATERMAWWKRAALAASAGISSDTLAGWR